MCVSCERGAWREQELAKRCRKPEPRVVRPWKPTKIAPHTKHKKRPAVLPPPSTDTALSRAQCLSCNLSLTFMYHHVVSNLWGPDSPTDILGSPELQRGGPAAVMEGRESPCRACFGGALRTFPISWQRWPWLAGSTLCQMLHGTQDVYSYRRCVGAFETLDHRCKDCPY